jgi:glutathione S-transferase
MKLYYFNIFGRAESIRFLLSHAKVEYEEVDAGPIMADLKKDKLEFGQVPLLETAEGHRFVQSWAILRYLGRTYGYYPNDAELAWKIDSTIDAVEDYIVAYFKYNFEMHEEKKAVFKEAWLKLLPIWVAAIEKRLEANGGKYMAGDKITIADFALAYVAFGLLLNDDNPHYAESLPLIKDHSVLMKYINGLKEDLTVRLHTRPDKVPF